HDGTAWPVACVRMRGMHPVRGSALYQDFRDPPHPRRTAGRRSQSHPGLPVVCDSPVVGLCTRSGRGGRPSATVAAALRRQTGAGNVIHCPPRGGESPPAVLLSDDCPAVLFKFGVRGICYSSHEGISVISSCGASVSFVISLPHTPHTTVY